MGMTYEGGKPLNIATLDLNKLQERCIFIYFPSQPSSIRRSLLPTASLNEGFSTGLASYLQPFDLGVRARVCMLHIRVGGYEV